MVCYFWAICFHCMEPPDDPSWVHYNSHPSKSLSLCWETRRPSNVYTPQHELQLNCSPSKPLLRAGLGQQSKGALKTKHVCSGFPGLHYQQSCLLVDAPLPLHGNQRHCLLKEKNTSFIQPGNVQKLQRSSNGVSVGALILSSLKGNSKSKKQRNRWHWETVCVSRCCDCKSSRLP